MHKGRLPFAAFLALAIAFAANAVFSHESGKSGQPPPKTSSNPDATASTESPIETMVRYAMPAPQHKSLGRMVGKWKTQVKYQMTADAPVVESEGSCERKWVLGNRFVLEEFDGGDLALPFRAFAFYGFDRFEEKYTSAWVDSLNTAITTYLGTCEDPCDVINFVGEHGNPWTGTKRPSRGVTRFVSENRHTVELYESGRDGREFRVLEITYTRQ